MVGKNVKCIRYNVKLMKKTLLRQSFCLFYRGSFSVKEDVIKGFGFEKIKQVSNTVAFIKTFK